MVLGTVWVVESLKDPGWFQSVDTFGNCFYRLLLLSISLYSVFKNLQTILNSFSDPFLLSADMMITGHLWLCVPECNLLGFAWNVLRSVLLPHFKEDNGAFSIRIPNSWGFTLPQLRDIWEPRSSQLFFTLLWATESLWLQTPGFCRNRPLNREPEAWVCKPIQTISKARGRGGKMSTAPEKEARSPPKWWCPYPCPHEIHIKNDS